ncbi:MAG: redoxin domain-containing protein [Candidatus Heimdallarchaeota archaeon]|nr:redoxin domain-containing protein [Candidatus Heimdallarchaeota archaeon]MBY8994876.1 redoxin domain-containing protein [Candidatus Heimdallarchaeota archaeon]
MRLKEGEKAINFTVTDLSGKTISLEKFKDKKILLSFYRYASCPLCNLRISQLIQQYDDMKKKGLVIIAFFQSPKESMLEYVGKQNVPFPLIPDPEREIYRLYRIEKSWFKYVIGGISGKMFRALRKGYKIKDQEGQQNLVPADFLIENMIIKRAYYGKSIADHISFEELNQFLEE